MDDVLTAIETLHAAVSRLKTDETLTFDQIVQAATLVEQVEQMVPAWKQECARFARVSAPAPVQPAFVDPSDI